MKPFQFARLPLILFGAGRLNDLPSVAAGYGKSVLLVTGAHSFNDSGHAGHLFEQLGKKGIKVNHISVPHEPSPDIIDNTVKQFIDTEIDVVISIGGGSVMDAGKAVSAMLYRKESVKEYLEVIGDKEHPGTKVPFIAVPTTSGTGSEATKNAVLSVIGKKGFKRSLRHDNFVPDIALVDPELTAGCSPEITAASGMDCFTQLVEAYLSTKANSYTDSLAIEGLKAVRRSLVRSYEHGSDIDARSDMSFAALTSGICLANAGLGAVHGLAGTLGSMYNIPHGVACGTLMAVANEITLRAASLQPSDETLIMKYATLDRIFSGEEKMNDQSSSDHFIWFLNGITDKLDMPLLHYFGIRQEDIPSIVAQSDVKNNPVKLSHDQMAEILLRRL